MKHRHRNLIAKDAISDQTRAYFNSDKPEVPMGHSQMLKTRRAKHRTKKVLAGIAKRAKKLGKKDAKTVGADAKNQVRP